MTTISAKSILASRHAITGKRVDTLLLRYPRWIHAEGRTHRQLREGEEEEFTWEPRTPSLMEDPNLSRNASSSRALPVHKMIQDVLDDTAIPIYWGKNQKGMQASEEHNFEVNLFDPETGGDCYLSREDAWIWGRDQAIILAKAYDEAGYHKQIVNRVLEPYSHITVVVTATEWTNFFALRRHKDAEPHIHLLADRMYEAMEAAEVQTLQPGEWHLPFVGTWGSLFEPPKGWTGSFAVDLGSPLKLSVARCASTSYKTVDGFDMTLDRAIALHDKLVASTPLHASPCEHQCFADDTSCGPVDGSDWTYAHPERHGNLKGFVQYRKTLTGECQ